MFDFNSYTLISKFFDPVNKKVIGKMQDELKVKIINGFVGLKSKMYSLITVDDEEVTKAKGVNKKIRHKEFLDVLFNKKVITHNMKRIQSKLHRIRTCDICKISLSCFDDKRYILDDGVNSLAYIHYLCDVNTCTSIFFLSRFSTSKSNLSYLPDDPKPPLT